MLLLPWLSSAAKADEEERMGEYWVAYHHGSVGTNEVFVADGSASSIFQRAGGVQSMGVYRVSERPGRARLRSYDVEVDCAKRRVRVKKADDLVPLINIWEPVKVNSAWPSQPEPWLARSRDFLCQPSQRRAMGMVAFGKLQPVNVKTTALAYMRSLHREQAIQAVLQAVDAAFEKMPEVQP